MPSFFKNYSNGGGHLIVTIVMQVIALIMMFAANSAVVTAGIAIMTLVATSWITPSVANMAAKKAIEKTATPDESSGSSTSMP